MKFKCPCCSYLTLGEERKWEICPVCFWEDDLFQFNDPNLKDGANDLSLNQAKKNFKQFKAIDKDSIKYVRIPLYDEMPKTR